MKVKTCFPGITAFAALLLGAGLAFASDDGQQSAGMNLVYRVVNILIFVGILYKFVGKRAKDFFSGRRESIRAGLADLEERQAEAEKKLAEVKKNIANLDAEREAILAESRAQAAQIKAAVLAEAERQAAQIREQASLTTENERKAAMKSLRAVIADEIAAATEALLQSGLNAALHDKLINNSLTKVVLN